MIQRVERQRLTFAGSLMGWVPVAAAAPVAGRHGLSIGIAPSKFGGEAVISVVVQGGMEARWMAFLTPDDALTIAEQLVHVAFNAAQAQAEAEQDAIAPGGAG